MTKELAQGKLKFKVECSRCGVVIRRTNSKDSKRLCLKCYARMLNEHARSLVGSNDSKRASER